MHSKSLRFTIIAGLALVILVLAQFACFATPSYLGYTGLIYTPTADTLRTSGVNLGAAFADTDNNDIAYYSGNVGVVDGLEVGGAVIDPDKGGSHTILNAKYSLLKENLSQPALAVGISDATDELDATPYIVLSKSFFWETESVVSPRFHIGVGGGRLDGLFGGVSASLNPETILMAEYDTNDVNFGVQYAISQDFRLRADLLSGDKLGFGISFNKGF